MFIPLLALASSAILIFLAGRLYESRLTLRRDRQRRIGSNPERF